MASEDSDQISSVDSSIHRLAQLDDLEKPRLGQVAAVVDHPHDLCEALEVVTLLRPERVLLEKRNYPSEKLVPPVDYELCQWLTMIVMSLVEVHVPAPEEVLKTIERFNA